MILYGRDLSPFARRVAVWCAWQDRPLTRRKLAVTGEDFNEIAMHNPVARVPVLILEDGTRLIETFAICDWLEETAPKGRRLIPAGGPERMDCLQRVAMANSATEKMVAIVYETLRRPAEKQWQDWIDRLTGQASGGLGALEGLVRDTSEPDGGDLTMAITVQFAESAVPALIADAYPKLKALSQRAMDWPGIAETMPDAFPGAPQPFEAAS